MSHDYHPELAGWHEEQLLVDGCRECEWRALDIIAALGHMDGSTFEHAWHRAADWQARTLTARRAERPYAEHLSQAEMPVLRFLWGVQVQLERRGIPIGWVPTGQYASAAANELTDECRVAAALLEQWEDRPADEVATNARLALQALVDTWCRLVGQAL